VKFTRAAAIPARHKIALPAQFIVLYAGQAFSILALAGKIGGKGQFIHIRAQKG
jgi:hypothetical protein